ncbi:hypothetical protein FACS189431_6320 [Alphaproteobacteria bacterium]|nr:hypothetical protein FACS189431_6320 [Alphaproteobacteria bacterium]
MLEYTLVKLNIFLTKELKFGTFRAPLWSVLAAVVILLVAVTGAALALSTNRSGPAEQRGRLVTIYDDTSEKIILSQAETVKDALEQAEIEVDPADVVEPSLSTQLIASSYSVNIYRSRPVVVVDGGAEKRVITAAQSGRTIAQDAGVDLYYEDETDIHRDDDILGDDGAIMRVTVRRAVPVQLVLYGQAMSMRTQAKTVGEFLDEKELKLDASDSITPGRDSLIAPNLEIKIWREGKNVVTVDEDVPFPVEQIQSNDHDVGYREVQTAGSSGRRSVTYEIEVRGGVEIGRSEIQSIITTQPVAQVEIIGIRRIRGSYTTPSENENITWDFLRAQGFSREQTAGIMGNLKQEHGFQTSGDGLAQWTGGRRAKLLAMPDPYNIYTQLEFLMIELNGPYIRVKNSLLAATSVESATIIFQDQFERCGVCAQDRRIQYAYNILASH